MKIFTSIFLLTIFFTASSQSFELLNNGKDTINLIDATGKKQGKWVVLGKHKPGDCYKSEQKIEEGAYKVNRKVGQWLEYYCNNNTKSQLTFINGRPDGYAIMFYENGNKKEEGDWKNNKWVGNYKLYYENGQVQHDFKFNQGGKREGLQTYNYDNGQVAVQGNFANGKESGQIKEFYETGDLKATKNFANGDVDVASIKTFQPKKELPKTNDAVAFAPSKAEVEIKKEELASASTSTAKAAPTTLNGKHVLYNKNKQVSKDGVFKESRLMEGKSYIYNENGLLKRVAVYKNGVYVGDGQVEN